VGCRTNQAESLALEQACAAQGAVITDEVGEADVVVINSCAVTSRAARDVRRLVGQARRLAPAARVIVTGCMVEVEDPSLWQGLGASDALGNEGKMSIASLVGRRSEERPRAAVLRTPRPALKVQEGCSIGCSYCIVPRTRGPERSVDPDAVVAGARDLARRGAREVVLSGTQLGSWGRDLVPPRGLADLVTRLLEARVVSRVRLSSVEPWSVTPGLLELLDARGMCRHLHVPLQSGSPRILDAMGRPGGLEAWQAVLSAVDRPAVACGTDVIVGFPGERDEDHEATRSLVEGSGLAYLHVFSFSPRPGTPAADLPHRPADHVVRARVRALRELSVELRRTFLDNLVGGRLEVVAEKPVSEGVTGTSSEFARVLLEGAPPTLVGHVVRARALRVDGERLVAHPGEVIRSGDPCGRSS
jgi:threonylcarbamoyladenosine tRNA methylthiotransferase MtaB